MFIVADLVSLNHLILARKIKLNKNATKFERNETIMSCYAHSFGAATHLKKSWLL